MHPYSNLPDKNFWKKFVSNNSWGSIDLTNSPKFEINKSSKISSAGSCFAQHISNFLKSSGLSPYIVETPHPLILEFGENTDSYNLFSARYGNIYTSTQCLELLLQAIGEMPVVEDFVEEGGVFFDLLRPNAIPLGFSSFMECRADRGYHLEKVRYMFETTDVFIFTLGLTESWRNTVLNFTYPVCPGTIRGEYDSNKHKFHNLSYAEVKVDLENIISVLKIVNPNIKIILTVSPVPLVATYSKQNVLLASSYSKSILRAVCGELDNDYENVQYFPSFEIVNHICSFGQYLGEDLRDISQRGVKHVMDIFFSTFFKNEDILEQNTIISNKSDLVRDFNIGSLNLSNVECDEIYYGFKK
jgi:hypothetical protein